MVWVWAPLGLTASVLVVAVVVLALPVRVQFLAEAEPRFRARVRLSLLGGLVPTIPLVDSWRQRGARRRPARKRDKARSRPTGRRPPPAAIVQLVVDLLTRLRVSRLRVRAVFGLADPAETGHLYGLLCPWKYGLPGGPGVIDVVPDFSGPRLEGRAEGVISLVPLALVPPVLRFGWRYMRGRS